MLRSRRAPSPTGARLLPVGRSRTPEAVVLVLHGGAQRRVPTAVRRTQLSVLRMLPIARAVARSGRGRFAVHRLLNSYRGWDRDNSPTDDVAWALAEIRESHGDVPVVLVGHSLGGRAALMAAGEHHPVRGVVALNPWLYPTDDAPLEGRSVLIVHGDADRIAPLEHARQVARRLGRRTDVTLEVVPGGKHAMLSQASVFEQHTLAFITGLLGVGKGAVT
ncbi:alpha/beta hydrolase [Nocardioides sp.]|uniref:alpha/beta hydrolase n=1 Tax=Nocardioides sp. TaxID=35761 RepID=UPI002B265FB8|nr:alpha/beta fold hydrolase [Nocardioides sp.]